MITLECGAAGSNSRAMMLTGRHASAFAVLSMSTQALLLGQCAIRESRINVWRIPPAYARLLDRVHCRAPALTFKRSTVLDRRLQCVESRVRGHRAKCFMLVCLQFRNDANCDTTWTELDDAFKRLQVRQPDAEQPAVPTDPVESRENQLHNAASSFFVDALERQPQPRVSQTRDSNTINDLDAHRLFLGRCNGAERLYKVFCLISSPGADDTSWVRLQFGPVA